MIRHSDRENTAQDEGNSIKRKKVKTATLIGISDESLSRGR